MVASLLTLVASLKRESQLAEAAGLLSKIMAKHLSDRLSMLKGNSFQGLGHIFGPVGGIFEILV